MATRTDIGLRPEEFRPTAAPVDRFRRTNAGSRLAQLADGLRQFNPSLQRFGVQAIQKDSEKQAAAGEAAARQAVEDRLTYNEAEKQGLITKDQNPFFRKHFKRQFGRLMALRYEGDLRQAIAANPSLANATDVEAFDAFEQEFREQWMGEVVGEGNRDLDFEEGFGVQKDELVRNARSAFSARVAANLQQQAGEAHYAEVHDTLQSFGGEFTPEQLGAYIQRINDDAELNGQDRTVINERTLDAIIAAALDANNEALLDTARYIKAGRHDLDDRPGASERIRNARLQIAQETTRRENAAKAEEEEAIRQNITEVYSGAVAALEANPKADISPFVSQMRALGPEGALKVETLYALQDAYENRLFESDMDVVNDAYLWAHGMSPNRPQGSMMTAEDAANLLATRQVTVPMYNEFLRIIQQRDSSGQALLNDRYLQENLADVARIMGSLEGTWQGTLQENLRKDAQDELRLRYIRWRSSPSGMEASEQEIIQWFNDNVKTVTDSRLTEGGLEQVRGRPDFPSRGNYRTTPMVPETTLNFLQSEVREIQLGQRNRFSETAARIFYNMGVPVGQDWTIALQAIEAQRSLLQREVGTPSTETDTRR